VPREERARKNAELFREVNERIHELEGTGESPDSIGFVCECSRLGCTTPVYVTLAQYRAVRAVEEHFLLVSEHVDPALERVVRTTDHVAVVERIAASP